MIGNWGHCQQNCPIDEEIRQSLCQTDDTGPKKNQPCVIPFIFDGKKRNGCVLEDDGVSSWCSTKVNSNLNHIGLFYQH